MKKWLLLIPGIPVLLVVAAYAYTKTPVFGARPDAQQLALFAESPQFNSATEEFENRQVHVFDQMREDASIPAMLREWFQDRPDSRPAEPLPEVEPNFEVFLGAGNSTTRIIWLGHSSILVRTGGLTILVDPVFASGAAPLSFLAPRFQPPVIEMSDLPPINVVLLSHDHYDHLDYPTIRFFSDKVPIFLATLGVGAHLKRWGVPAAKIVERDWWQEYVVDGVTFTATPAQHFSGRDGIKNNTTLWASWVIKSNQSNLFFSGDSGFDTHFKTIGDRFGPFDLAFLEDGQYDKRWSAVHMMPEEAAQAAVDLRASRAMPVHWGMFELAFHTWFDPIVRFNAALESGSVELVAPRIGEVIAIDDQLQIGAWWEVYLPE